MTASALRPPLLAVTWHIVERLASAAVAEVRARYDMGVVLLGVQRAASTAADRSILRKLAELLGVHPSALRRYARVSETIGEDELTWMMGLRTRRGMPLTWSHVDLLARQRDPVRRRRLAKAVIAEDLSVRALASRIQER